MGAKTVLILLYSTALITGIALCTLLIMTPLLLKQMEWMTVEWENDFDSVKVKGLSSRPISRLV